ncbi:YcaO-like family protein [Granulicella sibirica]|uniref:SagD family docking scaffold n=1 Tax=Granulicella sibirica TaxID=2479048 RepID=A0A4Q0SZI9_9BACT|nr:YcaO-like family protein [Granulicella sibirica]RXH56695.1 SagD family docking scaffold [Granulicella sibirica]
MTDPDQACLPATRHGGDELPSMRTRKVAGTQRVVRSETTLQRVQYFARLYGVTRLADITRLDRIGLPTYSAIVPRSEDSISVYNGKGLDPVDAKVGALMEALERQVALKVRLPMVQGSFRELKRRFVVLDPRRSRERVTESYSEDATYCWIWGKDLIGQCDILVPATWAGYFWHHLSAGPHFELYSSNGLASGNILEEAICQALCELVERDAWTLADIGAHYLPWARHRLADPDDIEHKSDDLDLLPTLELEDDPAMKLYHQAGLDPVLHDITSDLGIPTVIATVCDELLPAFPMVHCGLGTHPDARIAVRRALTEAAQSRCVDIQAVREDLLPPDAPASQFSMHTRRVSGVNRTAWAVHRGTKKHRLCDLPSAIYNTVEKDIEHILMRLRNGGVNQAIVVDLTPPGVPFAVVRVIVPELETWSVNRGPLGERALRFWRAHV